jgi:GNAT superfamily N-acetyltransferase
MVRAARESDAARVAELAGQLGYPSTPEQARIRLAALLADADHAVFVAELPETPVAGWVHVFLYHVLEADLRAEIGGLVVDAACRRRGVGFALMRRAEAWAAEKGCATVSLRSNVIREEAHAFYRSLGYSVIKTQHAFRKTMGAPGSAHRRGSG